MKVLWVADATLLRVGGSPAFNTAVGGRPTAGDFRLRAQKKVTKEKGTLVRRHCGGAPVLLAKAGPVELALDR